VAAEIDSAAAAVLLDAAHPLLLGTAEDLAKVAQRYRRPLVTIARAEPRRASAAVPEPAAVVSQRAVRSLFRIPWRGGRSRGQTAARVA
jgi:hypothetical protein